MYSADFDIQSILSVKINDKTIRKQHCMQHGVGATLHPNNCSASYAHFVGYVRVYASMTPEYTFTHIGTTRTFRRHIDLNLYADRYDRLPVYFLGNPVEK